MKTKMLKTKILLSGLLVALATVARAGTNDLTAALQRGLFEEEANHNLPAAIQAYQSVIAQFDKDRKLAATAVFRLGECYRKQGSTNEAAAQYERIVREFADQAPLVELSRQRLPAQAALAAGQPAGTEEQKRLLDEEIKVAEQKLSLQKGRYKSGNTDYDAVLTAQRDLLELKGRRAALDGPQPVSVTNLSATPSAELEELARIQEMVRNSPDLLNAPHGGIGLTPLAKAAEEGQLMVAQYLLKSGAEVNLKSPPSGQTALYDAATLGHLAVVKLLLEHGAAVNVRNDQGWTALHSAVEKGFRSVAEALLAAKADVNARTERGDTPLHLAAAAGQTGMVDLLLAHKAEVNIKNTGFVTMGNVDPYRKTHDATPLIGAIVGNHVAVVKLLLAAKADVNLEGEAGVFTRQEAAFRGPEDAEWGSPLLFALWVNSPEMVALLLDDGANPNAPVAAPGQSAGMAPLGAAAALGRTEIAKLLLAHKADPNLPDAKGKTPLHWAILTQHKEMVNLLLANHAEVNRRDRDGRTPLGEAAAMSPGTDVETGIAAALLEAKAGPNLKDNQGQTPLFYAAQGHKEMVELLLAKGANPNVRDKWGRTPLALAKTFKAESYRAPLPIQSEIAALLRQHGAIEELPRMDVIKIRRPSANFSEVVFTKGTNNYNHFTLFELIAAHYGFFLASPGERWQTYNQLSWTRRGSLAFPDLRSITVHHPTEDGLNWTVIHFDVGKALQRSDPDVGRLAWGDVVEVPEADHPINAVWQGLPEQMLAMLKQRVERQVQLTVKGQTTNLLLSLLTTAPPGVHATPSGIREATPPNFFLLPVLYGSGLLRASSDLSRINVKRRDAATGQVYGLVFDCSDQGPGSDFWLRNGDAIEVPEKP